MNIVKLDRDKPRRLADRATGSMARPDSALAALLFLAVRSPLRRCALPAHYLAAQSSQSNCRF